MLPDFFLIGPSGQFSAGAQLKVNIVLFLVGIALFLMCRPQELEHTFKRMAQLTGKQALGQSARNSLSCVTLSLISNHFKNESYFKNEVIH